MFIYYSFLLNNAEIQGSNLIQNLSQDEYFKWSVCEQEHKLELVQIMSLANTSNMQRERGEGEREKEHNTFWTYAKHVYFGGNLIGYRFLLREHY